MKKLVSKYYILLLLALMFAAPGIVAYLFYQHPNWLGSATVNQGHLLNPPWLLNALDSQSKWRIVFWSPGVCDKVCFKHLELLARVRLALGRKLYYVDQWLILGDKAPLLSIKIKSKLKEQDFHVAQLSRVDMGTMVALPEQATVYLANPDRFLILSYSSQAHPDDIYKDLKLLLNTTQTKND